MSLGWKNKLFWRLLKMVRPKWAGIGGDWRSALSAPSLGFPQHVGGKCIIPFLPHFSTITVFLRPEPSLPRLHAAWLRVSLTKLEAGSSESSPHWAATFARPPLARPNFSKNPVASVEPEFPHQFLITLDSGSNSPFDKVVSDRPDLPSARISSG